MQTGDVLYFGSGTEGRLPYRHCSKPFIFWGIAGNSCRMKSVLIMISLHNDVVNLVTQCDLLGWLCCRNAFDGQQEDVASPTLLKPPDLKVKAISPLSS